MSGDIGSAPAWGMMSGQSPTPAEEAAAKLAPPTVGMRVFDYMAATPNGPAVVEELEHAGAFRIRYTAGVRSDQHYIAASEDWGVFIFPLLEVR